MIEDIKVLNQFERIELPRPIGDAASKRPEGARQAESFEDALESARFGDVKISKHAKQRLKERDIELTQDSVQRLRDGINTAGRKGMKNALIIIDENLFVVNVPNRTVVTGTQKQACQENVFTNINGALLI